MSTAGTDSARAARMSREERRAQVLSAARDAFVKSGFHLASMEEIAEGAGVTKPVLYQHFASKLDLYLALLDSSIEDLLAATETALQSTHDNKQRVRDTMRAYFAFVADPRGAYPLLFSSDIMSEPAVRERVERAHNEVAAKIAAVIAEDTDLSQAESLLLGSGLQGLAQVAATRWLADPGTLPRDQAADLIAALAWRGIRGFPLQNPPQA